MSSEDKPKVEVKFANLGKTATVIHGDRIAFVKVKQDDNVDRPSEDMDGEGEVYSLHRDHENNVSYERAMELLTENPDAVRLSYYEHGLCLWMVAELPSPAGVEFQWDGTRFAGIWIPDECAIANIDAIFGDPTNPNYRENRREVVLNYAKGCVDTFTQWCNGEVYGYEVDIYPLHRYPDGPVDEEYEDETAGAGDPIMAYEYYEKGVQPIYTDSVWGYYGTEAVEEAATEAIEYGLLNEEVKES